MHSLPARSLPNPARWSCRFGPVTMRTTREAMLVNTRRRRIGLLVGALVAAGLLLLGGVAWTVWWVSDNIGAPGPGPTGSGPCSSADSVNLTLVFADGHVVQACTRDRPACPNQTISGTMNGQALPSVSQFTLSNQLRSSSRRYIFSMRFDGALPVESAEQTLQLDPRVGLPPGLPGSATTTGPPQGAIVQISPRDPYEDGYATVSGSVTVSSSHGVAFGRIDGGFGGTGPIRPDRPVPSSTKPTPLRIAGSFACNH